jgi:hypothetical protein
MAYVVRTRTTKLSDGSYCSTDCLVEMTRAAALKAEATTEPGVEFNMISGAMAHRYVKRGMQHETPLYVDDTGRVRYARDSY